MLFNNCSLINECRAGFARRIRKGSIMKKLFSAVMALALSFFAVSGAHAATGKRITVTGEIVDTWCYVTEIMFGLGTAHHQCAVWCAIGGIPVSVKDKDGNVFVVLRVEGDDTSIANPRIIKIQSHEVTVDGDLYERDGVKYLIVTKVANDQGIINMTHEEYGIQPFGK